MMMGSAFIDGVDRGEINLCFKMETVLYGALIGIGQLYGFVLMARALLRNACRSELSSPLCKRSIWYSARPVHAVSKYLRPAFDANANYAHTLHYYIKYGWTQPIECLAFRPIMRLSSPSHNTNISRAPVCPAPPITLPNVNTRSLNVSLAITSLSLFPARSGSWSPRLPKHNTRPDSQSLPRAPASTNWLQ